MALSAIVLGTDLGAAAGEDAERAGAVRRRARHDDVAGVDAVRHRDILRHVMASVVAGDAAELTVNLRLAAEK